MLLKSIVLFLSLLLLLCCALFVDYWRFTSTPIKIDGETMLYEIKPGISFKRVAASLHEQGILSRPIYWRFMAFRQGKASKIKAGQYRLRSRIVPAQLLDLFVNGKTVLFRLTLLEGWTYAQVMAAVRSHPQILCTLPPDSDVMSMLGLKEMHPEGWFYPSTYHFPKGTTDLAFLKRAYRLMRTRLEIEWASKASNLPLKSPYEALILASIVEKETADPAERPLIAAVFLSRLNKGMRLQTDPTVIYGLGNSYNGNLSYQNLRRDTPYNTYLHRGLTPTPIALPSAAALHAVLNPAPTKALYFVAKGDGSHHFSETYKEHRKAVIKYQLGGNAHRYRAQE